MDATRFTASKTGELAKFRNAQTGKDEWLFVPADMPPAWKFPERLWPLLLAASRSLEKLDGMGQELENPDLLLRPLQNREALTSSSIEGTYVTPQQLLLYELEPKEPVSGEEPAADWLEVFNYRAALVRGIEVMKELPVCDRLVTEMHRALMLGVRGSGKSPGQYRNVQVQIGATGRYIPPPPADVPRLMLNLQRFVNDAEPIFDPLIMCFIAHYQFEAIHPFEDGNGRVGRALLSLMIANQLGHAMPWLYLSAFFERYKDEYIESLLRVSTHGDWERWVEFCLTGTTKQAKDAIRRCKRFNQLKKEYCDRLKSPTPRSRSIIDSLFTNPILSVASVAERTATAYQTARRDLERLVECGILRELPDIYPRSFYAYELFRAAYDPEEPEAA